MCRTKLVVGVNDLQTTHPELAKQAHGWDSTTVSKGCTDKYDWFCIKCKGVYSATVNNRTGSNTGCPYCAGQKVLIGYNDLQTTHPKIAKQAYNWDPRTVSKGCGDEYDWFCNKCKGVYSATVKNRTCQNTGCPYCAGQQVLVGFNDLKTTHPEVAKEAYRWDPKTVTKGCGDEYDWLCGKCKGVYSASVCNRTCQNTGCPYCAGKQILIGYNDLTTTHPEIAKQAYGWDPKTVTKGCGDKYDWFCNKCKGIYKAYVYHRTRGSGCPLCCESGFNAQKPAYLYFLKRTVNKQLQHKIGICNVGGVRLHQHKSKGWQVVDKIHFKKGKSAKDLETKIKDCLANMNIKTFKCLGEEKFDGYTECWRAKQLTASSIKHLLKILDI